LIILVYLKLIKVVEAYCSTVFTPISNVNHSNRSNIISNVLLPMSTNESNRFKSLFDFSKGLYFIDSHDMARASRYLCNADLTYLEQYEKCFILYNAMHCSEFKSAADFLNSFQDLNLITNVSSMSKYEQEMNFRLWITIYVANK
jgi:hypothetical protein